MADEPFYQHVNSFETPPTSFLVPTPAKPTSIRCGGKIARCNVPVATATTSIRGAITTTDQGVNATGATAASAPSTISRTPCSIKASGRSRTGFWPPFCSVWRARLAASPERWVCICVRAIVGAGGSAMPRCPMRCIVNERGPLKPMTSTIPRATRGKRHRVGRNRWGAERVVAV
jgi:hypothetical protein